MSPYWAFVQRIAAEVETWPYWKRLGCERRTRKRKNKRHRKTT